MFSHQQVSHFRAFGFVVLPARLDRAETALLSAEVTGALTDAYGGVGTDDDPDRTGGIRGDYLPLSADRAPLSQVLIADVPRPPGAEKSGDGGAPRRARLSRPRLRRQGAGLPLPGSLPSRVRPLALSRHRSGARPRRHDRLRPALVPLLEGREQAAGVDHRVPAVAGCRRPSQAGGGRPRRGRRRGPRPPALRRRAMAHVAGVGRRGLPGAVPPDGARARALFGVVHEAR